MLTIDNNLQCQINVDFENKGQKNSVIINPQTVDVSGGVSFVEGTEASIEMFKSFSNRNEARDFCSMQTAVPEETLEIKIINLSFLCSSKYLLYIPELKCLRKQSSVSLL